MKSEQAESIATQALIWLAQDEDLVGVFLSSSGLAAEDLRKQAQDAEFLGFVLDFILMADEHVIGFSGANGLPPETVLQARMALPGGDHPNWT